MSADAVDVVAAVAENGVIGRAMDLPWRLPSDLAHFKALTLGHTLVMGRRTFQSIGRPLPGRTTIVVTRTPLADIACVPTLSAAVARADGRVFLAGGAQIYAEGMAIADTLHITRVHAEPDGDTFFPPIKGFVLECRTPGRRTARDAHDFTFETWVRRTRTT